FALAGAVAEVSPNPGAVGQSLRDGTRVAGSDPVMWRDIWLDNRGPLLALLDGFGAQLGGLRRLIEAGGGGGARGRAARRPARPGGDVFVIAARAFAAVALFGCASSGGPRAGGWPAEDELFALAPSGPNVIVDIDVQRLRAWRPTGTLAKAVAAERREVAAALG